jgi:hypothetical protein
MIKSSHFSTWMDNINPRNIRFHMCFCNVIHGQKLYASVHWEYFFILEVVFKNIYVISSLKGLFLRICNNFSSWLLWNSCDTYSEKLLNLMWNGCITSTTIYEIYDVTKMPRAIYGWFQLRHWQRAVRHM